MVVLLVNIFGYFISFSVQRYKIRAEVKQMLKEERKKYTQQFVFTEDEYAKLNQYEGGREFSLNGGMYDVVKKELKHGKIILTAYYDHKETGLLDKLVSFFDEESNAAKGKQTIPAFSLLEFVSPAGEWKCYNSFTCLRLYHSKPEFPSQLSVDLVSPPPDRVYC